MAKNSQKPETERRLSELQEEFLIDRSQEIYKKMFLELLPYARSLILKKTKGKIFLHADLVDEASVEATIKFMNQYNKPNFKIETSFAGIMGFKVLESLYGPKIIAADSIASLNAHIDTCRKSDTELGDLSESFGFAYLFRPDNNQVTDDPATYLFNKENDAINSCLSVLTELKNTDITNPSYFRVLIGIINFVNKSKNYDRYKSTFLVGDERRILDLALLDIMNKLRNIV